MASAEVRLAIEVLELPGLAGGVGDQTLPSFLDAQVADPPGQQASLEEGHGGLVLVDQPTEPGAAGRDGGEAPVVGRMINAGNALVLAPIKGENGVGGGRSRAWILSARAPITPENRLNEVTMNSSRLEEADNTKREPRRRRMNRLSGAILVAFLGLIAFFSVASNPRFETFHTLDVIRLMIAGAGAGVALTLLIDFSFPGLRSEPRKDQEIS